MAKLHFRVSSDVDKVIQLRKEVERLESALRSMDRNAKPIEFEKLAKELVESRKELTEIVSTAEKAGKALEQGLSKPADTTVAQLDKLNQALVVQRDEQTKLSAVIRDLRLERQGLDKQSEEYKRLSKEIKDTTIELNKEKDLTQALNSEKRKITTANRMQTVSEADASKALSRNVQSIREAREQNKLLRKAVIDVKGTDEEAFRARSRFNQKIEENTAFIKRNSDAMTQQKMGIGDYKRAINEAWTQIQNGTNSTKNFGIVANNTGKILRTKLNTGLREVSVGVGTMIKGFVGANLVMKGINSLIGALRSGVNAMIDFEEANSNLASILQTNVKSTGDLQRNAKFLGATTKFTAGEVTGLQIELAKLGKSREDILAMSGSILKFAQATGASLPDAAKVAGSALSAFGGQSYETSRYVSAMGVATVKSAMDFRYIESALSTVAPVAKSFGFAIEDVLGLLGKLSDSGFDASTAATATRNILLNLADANGKLAQSLGRPVKTLPDLVAGLKELQERGVSLAETLELTDKRSVSAFNTFLDGADGILELKEAVTGADSELGIMADTMDDNVRGAINGLKSAWEGFILSFDSSTGVAKDVINFFTRGIRAISQQLASDDQRLGDREQSATDMKMELASEAKIVETHANQMRAIYDRRLKEGKDANEAERLARKEATVKLESELRKRNNLYEKLYKDRNETLEQLDKANFVKQAVGMQKTTSVLKRELKGQEGALADLGAEMQVFKMVIEALDDADLKPVGIELKVDDTVDVDPALAEKLKRESEQLAKQRADALARIDDKIEREKIESIENAMEKRIALIELAYRNELKAIDLIRKEADLGIDDGRVREMEALASQRRFDALEEENNKLLGKYKTYQERRVEITKKYENDINRLREQGAEVESVDMAKALRDEELDKLDSEILKSMKSFETWSDSIINLSIEQLTKLLDEAIKELDKVVASGGGDTREALVARGKIEKLKSTINDKENVPETSTVKRWQELGKTVDSLKSQFSNLGKEIGGVAGDVLDVAGNIASSTISMIGSIATVTESSTASISETATATEKTIAGLEKASAILAIISASFQVISKIGSLFSGKAKRENREALKTLRLQNIELEHQYRLLLARNELEKDLAIFGETSWKNARNLAKAYKDQYEELQKSQKLLADGQVVTGSRVKRRVLSKTQKDVWSGLLDAYPKLIDENGKFDKSLAESILSSQRLNDEAKKALEVNVENANELESIYSQLASQLQSVFGELGNSISDNFAKSFTDGSDAMVGIYDDAGKMIENLAKQMILDVAFGDVLNETSKQMMQIQTDFALSDEEKFKKLTEILGKTMHQVESQAEYADSISQWAKEYAEEMGFEIFKNEMEDIQASRGKGFETMTQDQATELSGRFTANNALLERIRLGQEGYLDSFDIITDNQLQSIEISSDIRNVANDILVQIANSHMELVDIRNNTGAVVEPIKNMGADISDMRHTMDNYFR